MERRVHFLLFGCAWAMLAGLTRQELVGLAVAEGEGETDLALFVPAFAVSEEADIKVVVHDAGYPAANVDLEFGFFGGEGWATLKDAASIEEGSFQFSEVPALGPGHVYYVLHRNADDPERVTSWATRELTVFGPDDAVEIGTFDIGNVMLLKPDPGAMVTLPATFGWEMRGLPTDSYELNLLAWGDRAPRF